MIPAMPGISNKNCLNQPEGDFLNWINGYSVSGVFLFFLSFRRLFQPKANHHPKTCAQRAIRPARECPGEKLHFETQNIPDVLHSSSRDGQPASASPQKPDAVVSAI